MRPSWHLLPPGSTVVLWELLKKRNNANFIASLKRTRKIQTSLLALWRFAFVCFVCSSSGNWCHHRIIDLTEKVTGKLRIDVCCQQVDAIRFRTLLLVPTLVPPVNNCRHTPFVNGWTPSRLYLLPVFFVDDFLCPKREANRNVP